MKSASASHSRSKHRSPRSETSLEPKIEENSSEDNYIDIKPQMTERP